MKKIKEFIKSKAIMIFIISVILFILLVISLILLYLNQTKQVKNPYDIKTSPSDNFVFLGDSITELYHLNEFYDELPVINSGHSGWTTDQILNSIDELVYIYNPTKVFLLIGTNDIEHDKDANYISNNIKKIVKKIKQKRPNCKIYIESIYPINNTNEEQINHGMVGKRTNKVIKQINKKIKKYCNEKGYTFINVYKELTDEKGNLKIEYTDEGLHLSNLGYIKVTKTLYKYLDE